MGNIMPKIYIRGKVRKKHINVTSVSEDKQMECEQLRALLLMFDTKRALIYMKIGEDLNELKRIKHEYNKVFKELDKKEGFNP